MTPRPLPYEVLGFRDRACTACPTPCALRAAHTDPCDHCPLDPPAWPQWDCLEGRAGTPLPAAPVRTGDKLAAAIETHVLGPATRYAPAVVAAVRKCGGCKADQRALNAGGSLLGEGKGPTII